MNLWRSTECLDSGKGEPATVTQCFWRQIVADLLHFHCRRIILQANKDEIAMAPACEALNCLFRGSTQSTVDWAHSLFRKVSQWAGEIKKYRKYICSVSLLSVYLTPQLMPLNWGTLVQINNLYNLQCSVRISFGIQTLEIIWINALKILQSLISKCPALNQTLLKGGLVTPRVH